MGELDRRLIKQTLLIPPPPSPNPANEHVTQVVNGLQQLIRQRIEAAKSSDMGDREKVAKLLFGPNGERNATPAMTRLLTSYMEMESESLTTSRHSQDLLHNIIDMR